MSSSDHEALIEVKIFKDENLIATRIEYNITGLKIRSWLGLFINDVEVARFRTNNQGEISGDLEPIPEEYHIHLMSLGGFMYMIRLKDYIAETGVLAGISNTVEDTDNESLPNVGDHNIELRYI